MPRYSSANLTFMAKSSPLLRRIASHDLFADKRLLEICRTRAARYASDEAIARLAASLPRPDGGEDTKELGSTEDKEQSEEKEGEDEDDADKQSGNDHSANIPDDNKESSKAALGPNPEYDLSTGNTARTMKDASPSPFRRLLSTPSRKPPRLSQSSPEFFNNYSKTVFAHSSASQSWILCTNLSYYLDVLDAAKYQAFVYSAEWGEIRHCYLPRDEICMTRPLPRDKFRSKDPGHVDIEIEEADEIIAKYLPDSEDEDWDEEEEDEKEVESDEDVEIKVDVENVEGDDETNKEDNDKDKPPSSEPQTPPSAASSRTMRHPTPAPNVEERRERFYQRHNLEAMVFRRLVEEFYQRGQRARPVTFAQMMKLHLGLSRVAHQHQQQMTSISTIFKRQKLHPNRNLRARMRHDAAVVMKSGGMSSPLSESISANEEWPDNWDIWPAKRRKIHGEGVQMPGTTPKNKVKNKASGWVQDETPFPDNVKW